MKIYTKTGDSGQTGLFSGKRISKAELRVEAYGTVDELNAHLGLLRDHCTAQEDVRSFLLTQQHHLFDLGAVLADDRPDAPERLTTDITRQLEEEIDRMNATLPPLRHFILPGGHPAVSYAHLCRTVCRRAERRVVALRLEEDELPALAVTYLNRLSDYCFVLGRYLASANGAEEVKWQPKS